ncbi:MAG: LCP family protein [Clostridia bacterium]|nr:LCP family protein [Clostridia bacterium]
MDENMKKEQDNVEETVVEFNETERVLTPQEIKTQKRKKRRKGFFIFFVVFMSVILISVGTLAAFVFSKLGKINYETPEQTTIDTNQDFVEEDDDIIEFDGIDDATGNSFREILKNWATNGGKKMSNKSVVNILLIGSDASAKDPNRASSADRGNTDVMMLASIDTKKETIKLVSFMRDSYTYMDQFDRYAKLNAACANGGPSYLVETIENDYKIEIDGYVMVDFDSFVQVIDILGGVRINVPQYVANHLTNKKKGEFPSGNVVLDGEQALRYCRVRYSDKDGDISRTARQREVINAIINRCKGATLGEINAIADVILANVRTNVSQKTILSYAAKAVTDNWANFTISEMTMPDKYTRATYMSASTAWIWIVDYPLAAKTTQLFLYGETNITLPEERQTAITIMGKTAPKKPNN